MRLIAEAIHLLETRKTAMLAEAQQIEKAIRSLRGLVDDAPSHVQVETLRSRPNRHARSRPPTHVNRDQARTDKLLAFLRAGPQRPAAIAKHLQQNWKPLHMVLVRLRNAGYVRRHGTGRGTTWALAKHAPEFTMQRPAADNRPEDH